MDLKAEFRDHNLKIPVEPSLWVEALFRETDKDAAKWMDSTPHIRRIVDNYENATANDAIFLEKSLKDKFPLVALTETTKTTNEMLAEFSQIKAEPLSDYYGRAVAFLRLINVNDRRGDIAGASLSGAEDMVLDMLIKAFVASLEDEELRLNSIAHGATSTGSLLKTYDLISESWRAMGEIQKQLVLYTTKQKAEAFDGISRTPQYANSIVARFSDQAPRHSGQHGFLRPQISRSFPRSLSTDNHQKPAQSQPLNPSPNQYGSSTTAAANGYLGPPSQSPRNNYQRRGYRGSFNNSNESRSRRQIEPNRSSSTNPIVNGLKKFTTECTKCGQLGHYSRSCQNPELQKWEQDTKVKLCTSFHAKSQSRYRHYPKFSNLQLPLLKKDQIPYSTKTI
ncbi:hypothetical protein K3495_g13733 [Podosphaera aphanis]|nr:hypothetical protein K3495_g13733 [Podosphaera aphanis]